MKITSSIANTFTQLLPPLKRHKDGISVGEFSLRLSNAPQNLEKLAAQATQLSRKTLATVSLLISAGVLACSDSVEELYISDKEQKNNYLINKINALLDLSEIRSGICDTEPTVNKVDHYKIIKAWNWDTWGLYDFALSGGKGQPGNSTVEACLIDKMQEQIDHPSCEQKEIDFNNLVLGLIIALSVSTILLAMGYGIITGIHHASDRCTRKNELDLEEEKELDLEEEGEQLRLLNSSNNETTKRTTYSTDQLSFFKPIEKSESTTQNEAKLQDETKLQRGLMMN